MSSDLPANRSEWAALDWKEAQIEIARLLNINNFMTFEENRISKSNRADVMVIKETKTEQIFGILEVKCYKTITPSIEKKAMKQGCRYLGELYKTIEKSNRWANKERTYFVSTIFTNDYPTGFTYYNLKRYGRFLPSNLVNSGNIVLFRSTPGSLMKKLITKGLAEPKQTDISSYF